MACTVSALCDQINSAVWRLALADAIQRRVIQVLSNEELRAKYNEHGLAGLQVFPAQQCGLLFD